ncbi:MAG: GNAT family N-acetyltransferase [Marinoscillum sp.]
MEISEISCEETWPIRQKVMWPDRPLSFVKLSNDRQGIHYGLFVENELISIISLFRSDDELQFRKFATVRSEQGKGYGSVLLRYVIDSQDVQGIRRIWCNAREDKVGFYEKFGMRKTSQTFEKGGISYVVMEKLMM